VQNLASQLQTQGLNANQALQAALANQQSALETQRLGATTGLEALKANQQADLEAQRLGGTLGLQGYEAAGNMAQTLSNIGSAAQQTDAQRIALQQQTAAQQQALNQQKLDMAYHDWQNETNDPYNKLQQYMNLLSGVPQAKTVTETATSPAPSIGQQLLGTGLGVASLAKMYGG
jgi:hypothetical protein